MAAKKGDDGLQQGFIEGMEPPKLRNLDRLAKEFRDARNKWQAAQQPMMEAKERLLKAMQASIFVPQSDDDPAKKLHAKEDGSVTYPIPDTDEEVLYTPTKVQEPDVKVRKRKEKVAKDE